MYRAASRRNKNWLCGLLLLVSTSAAASETDAPCYDKAGTQQELNQCAASELGAADRALNEVYEQVLREYRTDPSFVAKLKLAQRAWVHFRDAEMEALFPEADKQRAYGTVFPMCSAQSMTQLTKQRTEDLRRWLKGREEGDLCSGSIRMRPQSNVPLQPTP